MTFFDDELDDNLREKLKLLEHTPPRDPEIARKRRDIFIQNAKYKRFGQPIFSITSLLSRKPRLRFFGHQPALVPFAAAIFVIFGLVLGSWGTVYAAQDSLPSDLLYTAKLTQENLWLTFTFDNQARVSLLTYFTDRRIDEATTLAVQGKPIPEELPERMDELLDEIFILTASMDEPSAQEALKGVQIHLRDQDQDMTNTMNGLPENLDPQLVQLRAMVKARQQVTLIGVDKPIKTHIQQQFKHQQGKPAAPVTDPITETLTITTTLEITETLTITPGHTGPGYGPGPCLIPGDCDPPGNTYGPGQFMGTPPVPDDPDGYAPGPDQGSGSEPSPGSDLPPGSDQGVGSDESPGPQQPTETFRPGEKQEPNETPDPPGGDGSSRDNNKKEKP